VYGKSRLSSTAWALEPGPKTPVTIKWAFGYCSAKKLMNGILPPSPIYNTLSLKLVYPASSMILAKFSGYSVLFQPLPQPPISAVTLAP